MPPEPHKLLNAAQRLRAMAEAFENGNGLTSVATRFRVPILALQRVVTPKRNLSRPSKVISPEMLATAVGLIRQRYSYKETAQVLKVPPSTLTSALLKQGFTAKNIRPPDRVRDMKFRLAVSQYIAGVVVAEISRNTGIPEKTLYSHFRRIGVPKRQPRAPESPAS